MTNTRVSYGNGTLLESQRRVERATSANARKKDDGIEEQQRQVNHLARLALGYRLA